MPDAKNALKLRHPDGREWTATSPTEWHNLVSEGYTPLGEGPDLIGGGETSTADPSGAKPGPSAPGPRPAISSTPTASS